MKLNSLSVAAKLSFGFSLITLITLIVGIYSIVRVQENATLMQKMFVHPYTVSNSVKSIHTDILKIHLIAQSLIFDKDLIRIQKKIDTLRIYDNRIAKNFKLIFQQYLGPKEDVQKVYNLFQDTLKLRESYFDMLLRGDVAKATAFISEEGKTHIKLLDKEIKALSKFADAKANEFFVESQKEESSSINYLYLMIFLAIGLSILVSVITIRKITLPIDELIDSTNKIREGKLILSEKDKFYLSKRKDEIGVLFNSFYELMSYLLLPYEDIIKSDRPLVEKTDELRRLLKSFNEHIIATKTDLSGIIIYASQAAEKITGYSQKEMLGRPQNIFRHPDMPKGTFKTIWKTISKGNVWQGEIKNKKKDGTSFWIRSIISPDIDSNGKIIGYNAISENITDTKAYEELSKTLETRVSQEITKNDEKTVHMLQQAKLAQMGEMISMIAHQWRQPLASISAISSTLSLDVMLENYKKEFFSERLDAIGDLSQHLSSTIDDFRSFFKNNKEKEEVALNEIIDGCLQVISSTLENKNISIAVSIDEDIFLYSYINEIKQVVLNILKNAEDALIETNTSDARISIKGYQEDLFAYLTLEDNAGGVPKDIINKIFDPYFSTKKQKDGTGLGLYMSKTIIEEHCDGYITLENTVQGASFIIKLPLSKKE